MSVYGEGQTLKNVHKTKTILNIELLFAKVDLLRTLTRGKKGIATIAVVIWPLAQELPSEEGGKDN